VSPVDVQWLGEGEQAVVYFILNGRTAAGATRTFELVTDDDARLKVQRIDTKGTEKVTRFAFRGQDVLHYNRAPTPLPPGVDDVFLRGATIHPIYTPSGKLMTEDFPSDHFHHKGLWQAWVNTQFEGRKIDFWNLKKKTGTVRYVSGGEPVAGAVCARMAARHEHLDLTQNPPKRVLDETWDVRVWAVGQKYHLFDLTSTQRCASDSPLHLKKNRYGGVGYRGPQDWGKKDYTILTSEGKTYDDAHATRARWCIHAGKVTGQPTSVVFMSHPDNPVHPEPMRTSGGFGSFFNWAPVQAGDFTLEPGKTYTFSYRFLIADGDIDAAAAESAWRAFGDPPRVTFKGKSGG